jgi:hypothetical protein
VFDPLELLERLAVITPRPRIGLILYHGILAPRVGRLLERRGAGEGDGASGGDSGAEELVEAEIPG